MTTDEKSYVADEAAKEAKALEAAYARQAELELQVEDAKTRRSWADLSRLREELEDLAREHGL